MSGGVPATLSSILGLDQDGLDALNKNNYIEFTLPQKEGQLIAFSSSVPTPAKSYQWFGSAAAGSEQESVQLMLIEIECCSSGMHNICFHKYCN
jgi:hypothetical protein